jgi:hypothetical protein
LIEPTTELLEGIFARDRWIRESQSICIPQYAHFRILANGILAPAEKQVLRRQSEICKTLANPKRLEILHELREGEKSVSELCLATGLRQSKEPEAFLAHPAYASEAYSTSWVAC